jgi:hypothetical protein
MYAMYDAGSDSSEDEYEEGDEMGTRRKAKPARDTRQANTGKAISRPAKAPKNKMYTTANTKIDFSSGTTGGNRLHGLDVEPSRLHFESVQPGILYVMTMSIRNVSQTAQRIRIKAPKSGFFALNYIPSGVVSPGLDIRAQIECQLPEGSTDLEYLDTITVVMGENELIVPIVATKKVADVVFDSLLNFGFVAKGHKATHTVLFTNRGEVAGGIKFNSSPFLTFQPPRLRLAPNEKQSVTVTLGGVDVGVFREVAEVLIEGSLTKGMLDVSAHCVPQVLSLLKSNGGGIVEEINFGALFYGETRQIGAFIVNSGPQQLSFSALCIDEDARLPSRGKTPAPDDDLGGGSEKNALVFFPSEGVIKPFSQLPVTISFSPEMPTPDTGFKLEFMSALKESQAVMKKAVVESIETGQRLVVDVTGSVSLADVTLSPNVLKFGSCPANDRRDILVELTNNSVSAVPFSFSTHAQYRVSPQEGVLDPHQSRTVIATFHPGQLGVFKATLKMSISNGLQVLELAVSGEANETGLRKTLVGGLHASPQDFQDNYKFVNPAAVEAEIKEQQERKLKKQLDKTRSLMKTEVSINRERELGSISTGSMTREAIYGQVEDVSNTGIPGDMHPLTLKRQHDAVYNTYLQSQHLQRTEARKAAVQKSLTMRGGIDRSDPFGVDMGMDRGLNEPKLTVPKADSELWLASKAPRGTDGKGRLPFDENRLIQRKYSDTPSTQAELRDCTAELSAEDLKLVHAAQKVSRKIQTGTCLISC